MNFLPNIFDRNSGTIRIPHSDKDASERVATELQSRIQLTPKQQIVFVCIGTDRSTGDSLGPLVGTLLEEKPIFPFYVYGTLDDPIHAVNLTEKMSEIKERHSNPFIIGIDACLGRLKSVGSIQVADGPVKPGAGVNKNLPEVGDIHITGIVNVSGFMEFFVLQNTRLNLVLKMAKTIANGIHEASIQYQREEHWSSLNWNQARNE